ncbi:adenosylcobinamide-phosphate synthase CbiB [Pseudodesulfovibrio tunisiensis]|uniref:adenosylcobinamide-phosphate synthase CbiB n=1 Tax=Pseudodesulfovibrio tunisiensis TaxID=463192 RepID=UPI001FB54AEA|nr:adenosylcobinamide-phosphate synthase CbiB [Pseudodesulfovibrio tunisiensis]
MGISITSFLVPAASIVLDRLVGDPQNWPHPVRFIGKGLDLAERTIRQHRLSPQASGWCVLILFSGIAWGAAHALAGIPYLGPILAVYLGFAGLAMGSLLRECRNVAELIDDNRLPEARHALSMLVSRDTENMGESELRRSLAETLSENLNDGFVAPVFYLCLFGPAGLWAYKTVSTLDSMWGYLTPEYAELGYAAAKTDDVLAFVPARIAAGCLLVAGKMAGLDWRTAMQRFPADAHKMESPNAGWPMAASAWLTGRRMGGNTIYFGKVKSKPILGPENRNWDAQAIRTLLKLVDRAGIIAAVTCLLLLPWL